VRYQEYPEYWNEFLEYVKKNDPTLIPIIEAEGLQIGIVKYEYLKWKENVKG
jgi:hypothetical protein